MKFYQRRSIRAIALSLGLIAGLIVLVHTRPFARFVAGLVEDSQEGRLRIGELSYRLWRGEVTLEDVEWTQPELTATIPEIAIQLSLEGEHVVRVRSPRVQWLGGTASGGEGPTRLPVPPPARIEIEGGALVAGELEVSGIDVAFEATEGSLHAGRITYPELDPASLEASFALEGNVLKIESATLDAYDATLRLTGTLDFDAGRQSFEAELSGLDLARFDPRVATRVSGRFEGSTEGFDYRTLEGEGAVTAAPDPEGEIGIRVSDERIHFESPRVASRGVEASIEGTLTFARDLDARFRARAQLRELHEDARGVLLAEGTVTGNLEAPEADASVRSENLRFEGTPLAVQGRARFAGGELRLSSLSVVHPSGARAVVEGVVGDSLSLTGRASYEREDIPAVVSASLDVTGPLDAPVVEASIEADAGGGHFTGTGRFVSATRSIALSGEGSDMEISQLPEVTGRLENLRFQVEGTLDAPLIQGTVLLTELTYRGVPLPQTLVTAESDGESLTIDGGELVQATTTLEPPYVTRAVVSLDALPLSALASTFPRATETELSVAGEVLLDVPLTDPAALRYRVEARNALGVYRGVVLGASAPFTVEGDLSAFRIEELDLIGADTAVGLAGTVPLSTSGEVNLDARGAFRIDLLQLWFPESELTGRANATLHIGGKLDEPEWNGDVVIDELGARFGDVAIEGNRIVIDGRRDGASPVRLQLEAENVVARSEAGEVELTLTAELASADANLANVEGRGRITSLVVRGGGLEMENREAASFTLANGLLSIEPVTFEEQQTTLTVTAEARPFGDVFEWAGVLEGRLNHALVNSALSELGITASGVTDVSLRATNASGELVVEGGGSWRDARLALRDPPLVLTNMNGAFELDGASITLTSLTADAGGGTVVASGSVALAGTEIENVDLTATASSVRLSYPEGLRSEIEGRIRLTGSGERLRLSGDIELNRAVFSRDIDVETELLQSVESVQGLADTESFAEAVQLDIRVSAADGLRIDNNLARLEATANLTLGGTLGTPELRGLVASRPGGRFRFGRNDYLVESGRIELTAYPTEPAVLDIDARTTVRNYDLRLTVRGPTDDLVTDFSAPDEPSLTQGDVASLLLTGRTLETVSSESRAVLGEQMASFLGSTLGDLAELGLGNALPIQIVTVEPALIAQETDPAARFTLGAGLGNELTVVYSIALDDAEDQIWVVDYELPRRARTQLIRRQDNELSIGITQKLQYDPRQGPTSDRGGARVSSVAIAYLDDDEPPESAPEIQRELRPRPGSRWDYWDAWEHAERVRERLREEGYLEATVDVVSEPCGDRCIDVRYEVVLGVPVAFLWRGDPVDDSLHEAVKAAWNGQLGEAFVANDLTTLAEGRLFAKGYYLAAVTATTQRTDQGVTVTVDFTRGPKGKEVVIDFDGNEALPDRVLRESLPERTSAELYELLTTRRPRFKQLLELRYASFGYLTAEVGDPERNYDPETGRLVVEVPVQEGPVFRTDVVDFEGVEAFEPATLRARIPLREGAVFRPSDFVQSRAAIASFYRQQGFPDVTVTASLLDREDEGALGARFGVSEGRRATVGSIAVAGNESTRDSVVLREAAFTEGETLELADVNETQRRLYELGAFRSAEVVVGDPQEDDTRRDVTIRVREVPRLAFEYGLRVATDGLFQVDTEVGAPNLFGRAHRASFRTLIASDQRTFRLNYHTPYFARYKVGTDFFLEREFLYEGPQPIEGNPSQETIPFTDRSWRFTVQQNRVLSRKLNVQWSYSFKRVETEIEDPVFGPSFLEEDTALVSGAIVGDYRDNVVRPTRGSWWSATLQVAPETLGSDSRFTKLFNQLYLFVPLGKGVVWASAYRLGVANDHGEPLDFDDGFRAGGPTTVRGFGSRELGPVDPLAQLPYGGSGLLIVNQEIRFPLFWLLRGVGFYDAGNAFEDPSDIELSELKQSLGLGLRLELPFGILRFDWARAIDPLEGDPGSRFIFTLGHAF